MLTIKHEIEQKKKKMFLLFGMCLRLFENSKNKENNCLKTAKTKKIIV